MTKSLIISFLLITTFNSITLTMENDIFALENGVPTNAYREDFSSCCECDHVDAGFSAFFATGISLRCFFPDHLILPYALATCIGAATCYAFNKKFNSDKEVHTIKFE